MRCTAIIPAYNEAQTVADIVRTVADLPQTVAEVIVVDDGSTDNTSAAAKKAGARVLRHEHNRGKAQAMQTGTRAAKAATHFLFLDADLLGLKREHVDRLLEPFMARSLGPARDDCRAERPPVMTVSIRDRGRILTWLSQYCFPWISGERVVPKPLWEQVPQNFKRGFQIELALNATACRLGYHIMPIVLSGVSIRRKEQKIGWLLGLWARIRMTAELVATMVRLVLQ